MNPPENSDTNVEPFYPAITPASLGKNGSVKRIVAIISVYSLGSDVVPSENEDTLDREGNQAFCKET